MVVSSFGRDVKLWLRLPAYVEVALRPDLPQKVVRMSNELLEEAVEVDTMITVKRHLDNVWIKRE